MDHRENADENHFSDAEKHDLHSFHSSCCFDEYVIELKKHDFYHFLNFEEPLYQLPTLSFQTIAPLEYSEYKLPPHPILDVLRVTRLLSGTVAITALFLNLVSIAQIVVVGPLITLLYLLNAYLGIKM